MKKTESRTEPTRSKPSRTEPGKQRGLFDLKIATAPKALPSPRGKWGERRTWRPEERENEATRDKEVKGV